MSHSLHARRPAIGRAAAIALFAAALVPANTHAQQLAARVAAAPEGRVQFTFPARAGVCGNGRSFVTIDNDTHVGTFINTSDGGLRDSCAPGPVRVVIDRADRMVIGVQTYVGPADTTALPATDLGRVSASDAADYLLGVAATADGRPGRDAIMPAALAEGVDAGARLLAIGRDAARPVETRRSALSWLAREASSAEEARRVAAALLDIARDGAQPRSVRQQALSVLTRLATGAGIPQVIALTRVESDEWLARESVAALARSGDPRARAGLREIVERAGLPDETLATAVRGLAGTYATSRDAQIARDAYTRLPGERSRQAVVSAVAEIGGADNVRWLLGVARSQDEREAVRRSALNGARRAGASSAAIAALYDSGDNVMRSLVVGALAEANDRGAVDKLLAIARSGDDRTIRRRAVSALAKLDDPRVKAALADIVER